jgi:ADP-ribose pyrophosphatase YjhB (NUDIX family)
MHDRDEDHFVGKVAQKVLIIKDNSVLLVRHMGSETMWELPGGRINVNEDPKAGLVREIKEELGVEVMVGDAISVDKFLMKRTNEPHIAIVYKAMLVDIETVLTLDPEEIAEVAWVTRENWEEYQMYSNYAAAVGDYFGSIAQ